MDVQAAVMQPATQSSLLALGLHPSTGHIGQPTGQTDFPALDGVRPLPSRGRSSDGLDAPRAPIDLAKHSRHRREGSFFHRVYGFEWYLSLERGLPLHLFNP